MATYGVDIEIGVKGQQQLQSLTREVQQLGRATDLIAESLGKKGKVVQSVDNYNKALSRAAKTLREVIAGTRAETKAIKQYAQALNDTIAIEQRQQKLVGAEFRKTPAGQAELELKKAQKSLQTQKRAAEFREKSARSQAAFEKEFLESAKRSNERVNERIQLQERLNSGLRKGAFEARMLADNTRLAAERKIFGTQFLGPATPLKADQASAIAAAQSTERLVRERSAQAAKKLVFNKNLELALLTKIVGKTGEQGLLQKQINNTQQRMIRDGQALAAQKERALAADKKAADLAAVQRKRGLGGAISSGLIGGGFPLLFGQGGIAAAGGALGGLAGGALGGGFGFALSIVGTALGQAIADAEEFDKSLIALNSGLDSTATSTSITASEINDLADALGRTKDETVEALAGFKDLGANTQQIKDLALVFGKDAATPAALAAVEKQSDLGKIILANIGKIGKTRARQLLTQLQAGNQLEVELELVKAIAGERERQLIAEKARINLGDRFLAGLAQAGSGAEGMAIGPILTAEQLRDERVARFSKKLREQLGLAVPSVTNVVQGLRELNELVDEDEGTKADPTINLEKRLNILNKQIASEKKFVGVSSEGASIIRRKLALESRIAQIQETGRAERKRLTDQEDISLSKSIQDQAIKLENLKFEREATALIERQNKAGKKLLEPLQKKLDAIRDRNAFEKEYGELIMNGSTPAAAKQVIEAQKQKKEIDRLVEKQLESNEILIANLRIKVAETEGTKAHAAAVDALNDALKRRNEIEEKGRIAKGEIKGEKTPAERIDEERKRIQGMLNELMDPVNQLISLANTLGNAFSESFRGIVDGSMSAQQALANLFQRTADHFLDMAAQMIAAQIRMQAMNLFMSFFSPTSGGTTSPTAKAGTNIPSLAPSLGGGGPLNDPKGLFTPPTLISQRAVGGAVGAGRPYLVGERGPELFVPGAQGNIVPNNAMGSTSVVVNVDASGTEVQGNQGNADQLGRLIGQAVQAELIKQRRPGGLLTR